MKPTPKTRKAPAPTSRPLVRRMWAYDDIPDNLTENLSYAKQMASPGKLQAILVIREEDLDALRWSVEQTYLRCADAEITDPWEIAGLVLSNAGLSLPAKGGMGRG